jgi:hypothetical protein
MSSSVCETYPGICSKSRLAHPRPVRLFHPANDNRQNATRPAIVDLPASLPLPEANPISVVEVGSAVSLLGLLIFAAHEEITAVAPAIASALQRFLANAPAALW